MISFKSAEPIVKVRKIYTESETIWLGILGQFDGDPLEDEEDKRIQL